MTKVNSLIRNSKKTINKKILLDTEYSNILSKHFNNYDVSILDRLEIFNNFDYIITDQTNLNKIDGFYKRFLSNIIVIDNISHSIARNDVSYWAELSSNFSLFNNNYKSIFVALNDYEYLNSNQSHNLLIDIEDQNTWRSLI
jgi:archaellum biogenesis ATPase FlaH